MLPSSLTIGALMPGVPYLKNEPRIATFTQESGLMLMGAIANARDNGIDLVAETANTNEVHAIQ